MTDSHQPLEDWLVEGAPGDPPRELAVHAAVCESCARRLGAFDSLATIDVDAAGSPPPLAAPTRVAVGLAWARLATVVAGMVVAGILVGVGTSQLVGLIGRGDGNPAPPVLVSLATPGGSHGPDPNVEPSLSAEPSETPISSFIPLPSQAADAPPLDPPSAPSLFLSGVGTQSIAFRWTPSGGVGVVQKWEVWRRTGSNGTWIKLGEVLPSVQALTNTGLASGTTYAYRVRGVNTAWLGAFSNEISATTSVPPPSVTPAPPTPPTPDPTPTPAPTPVPQCSDGQDNDSDGYVDLFDPACQGDPSINSESPFDPHECNDGNDNDGDHLVDSGEDPACGGDPLGAESPPNILQCNDGLDNDGLGDGIDFGGDPECASWSDDDESA